MRMRILKTCSNNKRARKFSSNLFSSLMFKLKELWHQWTGVQKLENYFWWVTVNALNTDMMSLMVWLIFSQLILSQDLRSLLHARMRLQRLYLIHISQTLSLAPLSLDTLCNGMWEQKLLQFRKVLLLKMVIIQPFTHWLLSELRMLITSFLSQTTARSANGISESWVTLKCTWISSTKLKHRNKMSRLWSE